MNERPRHLREMPGVNPVPYLAIRLVGSGGRTSPPAGLKPAAQASAAEQFASSTLGGFESRRFVVAVHDFLLSSRLDGEKSKRSMGAITHVLEGINPSDA